MRSVAALIVGLLLVGACDRAPTGPTPDDIPGLWLPERLELVLHGDTVDLLASKYSHFRLQLFEDGLVLGRLIVPDWFAEGRSLDADMKGAWTLQGRRLRLEQSWDTFVRDLDLRWLAPDTLAGTAVRGDSVFSALLARHHPPGGS